MIRGNDETIGANKFVKSLTIFHDGAPDNASPHEVSPRRHIGNYVHGNEPSHHAAYLYNWTDAPWKTHDRVRMILKHQYKPTPDVCGATDDRGQMWVSVPVRFFPSSGSGHFSWEVRSSKTAMISLRTEDPRDQASKARNVYVSSVV